MAPEDKPTHGEILARLDQRMCHLCKDVKEIKEYIESHLVSKNEFNPVRLIVYGLVGILLASVLNRLLH